MSTEKDKDRLATLEALLEFRKTLSDEEFKLFQEHLNELKKKFPTADGIDKESIIMFENQPSWFNEKQREAFVKFVNILRNDEGLPPLSQKSNNMMYIIIAVIILLLGGGAVFFFMKKPKKPSSSSMSAFGQKLAKIVKV
jgi:hypothetical protein